MQLQLVFLDLEVLEEEEEYLLLTIIVTIGVVAFALAGSYLVYEAHLKTFGIRPTDHEETVGSDLYNSSVDENISYKKFLEKYTPEDGFVSVNFSVLGTIYFWHKMKKQKSPFSILPFSERQA